MNYQNLPAAKKFLQLGFITILATSVMISCKKDDDIQDEKKEQLVVIQTKFGNITIWLWDETPLHKENFLELTASNYYDSLYFHRVIDEFMIQGGCPNTRDNFIGNDGQGGPGYTIPAEIDTDYPHVHGAVGAARMPDAVNPDKESSGSQFYIVDNVNGTPQLNGNYTVFGQVLEGLNVVDSISQVKTNSSDNPKVHVYMDIDVLELSRSEIETNFGFTP
jgi:peptidyl-prolyl cis-trans isomerase B (cyclophilin B)